MPRFIQLFILLFILPGVGIAQRVVENPDYKVRMSGHLSVERITLYSDSTVVDFLVEGKKGYEFSVPKHSHLRDEATGKMYLPLRAQGIELGHDGKLGEDKAKRYSITFPAIPADVSEISFIEGGWDVYDIRLDGAKTERAQATASIDTLLAARPHSESIPPVFTPGNVTIRGYIPGYDPRIFGDIISIRTSDNAQGKTNMGTIPIAEDGTFSAEIRIGGPGYAWFDPKGRGYSKYIYLEPGEDLNIILNTLEVQDAERTGWRKVQPLKFGGSLGEINNALASAPGATYHYARNWEKQLTTAQAFARLDSISNRDVERIEKYIASNPGMHPGAVRILRANTRAQRGMNHLDYLMDRRDDRSDRGADTIGRDYYRRFLPELLAADSTIIATQPVAMALLNRLSFCSLIELLLPNRMEVSESLPRIKGDKLRIQRINTSYCDEVAGRLCRFLGVKSVPLLWQMSEVAYLTSFNHVKPLDKVESALEVYDGMKSITCPALKQGLHDAIYDFYTNTLCELPDTRAGQVMRDIIKPYAGRPVIVDFWGTGCGPCRANIEAEKEYRDSHRGPDDVVFIFITGEEESPEAGYEKYVAKALDKDITLRIPQSDFNLLRELFNFSSIPHKALIARDGTVASPDFRYYLGIEGSLASAMREAGVF